MLGELANADKTSFESIHICHRALHSKGKEPDNDPGILQRHHVNDSNASISGPDEGATESETAGWLTPLHVAAQKGRGKLVDILLQHAADCNAKDSDSLTPLAHATICGHEDVITLLLAHGARMSEVDNQCRTVLHWAVMHRRDGVLKVLLEHCGRDHAFINKYDRTGRAPVHMAIEMDFEEGLRLLLQFGADVHSKMKKHTSES
ncbi:hypothetical protein VSDG_00675 [Cytospora chrysosperma]|uniref:Uncharacterized protein n=1 Tax=Cytospora chrysosperma TaxID=252740 RepID=A0A423WQI0_CYTCH|nr:hypothetical protein VSDG_00675 [Valsa sordida]